GIAKARGFLIDNEGEVVAGKADYMSPEQANFQITDKRSDLFSVGVVLGHLLLGRNVFKGPSPQESRKLVMNLPIPHFPTLDGRIDDRLNTILHKALSRDLNKRYASADEMLFDLEHYIYHSGYGPTNETLGKMIRELFGHNASLATNDARGSTQLLERTARSTALLKQNKQLPPPRRFSGVSSSPPVPPIPRPTWKRPSPAPPARSARAPASFARRSCFVPNTFAKAKITNTSVSPSP